jgi:hypothetical protein
VIAPSREPYFWATPFGRQPSQVHMMSLCGRRNSRAVATIVRANFFHRVSCGTVEIAQLFVVQLVGSTGGVGIVPALPT